MRLLNVLPKPAVEKTTGPDRAGVFALLTVETMQKHASAKHSSPLALNYIVRLSLYRSIFCQGLPDGILGMKHPELLMLVVLIEREEKIQPKCSGSEKSD